MTLSGQILSAMQNQLPEARHLQMAARWHDQAPALLMRLQALYGDRKDFSDWCVTLMRAVADVAAQRPDALLKLDQQRAQDKDWFCRQEMLGYCTYVDRFAGNLIGVLEKIPHLTEMGVRYLHLLPFLRAREGENDGGFAVSNFSEIEPRFGTMEDLRNLTTQLRAAGISLCSDFVLNHVADDHRWALAAKKGDQHYQDFFYCYSDRTEPNHFEQSLGQVFPQAAPGNFSYVESLQRWVWTTFYPYQWDLNYTNPAVFAEAALALLHLANQGIEVFRLDSTAYLWKRAGSNCMDQPEAHWILQALRSIVEIAAPGVLLKAEAILPTAQLPAYLGSQNPKINECHLAYHSSLMTAAWAALSEQNVSMLAQVIQNTPALPEHASWLTYVRCHDDIGWNILATEALGANSNAGTAAARKRLSKIAQFFSGEGDSYARGASFQASNPNAVHGSVGMASALCGYAAARNAQEDTLARRRLLLLYGLALTFGGLPVIYMGDELAQGNDALYRENPTRANDSRWLQRPEIDHQAYTGRHDAATRSGQLFTELCQLLRQRRLLPQLAATQARQWIDSGRAELLIFARGDLTHEPLFYVANFSDHAVQIDLTLLKQYRHERLDLIDVLSQQIYVEACIHPVILQPYAQLWLHHAAEPSNGGPIKKESSVIRVAQ